MDILGISNAVEGVLDKFIPDADAREKAKLEIKRMELDQAAQTTERMALFAGPLNLILYCYAFYLVAMWVLPIIGYGVPELTPEIAGIAKTLIVGVVFEDAFTSNDIQIGQNGSILNSPAGKGILKTLKKK